MQYFNNERFLKIDTPSYEEIFIRQQFAEEYYNKYASKKINVQMPN